MWLGQGTALANPLAPSSPPKPTAAGLGTGTRPRGAAQAGRWVPPWGWVPHGPHWPHTGTSRPRAPLPPWQPLLHEAILSRRRRSERVTAPMAPSPPPTSRSGTNKRLRAMDGGAWKPGGEAERGGAVQDCIHIPTPGRGQNPAGSWGTPESPGPRHCPRPMAAGGRGDGRSCPAGRCPPCLGAGRHVPSCCRSQPKITTVPLPIRAAREACGLLLGSSSALQLEVHEGGFSMGRAHPGVGVQGSQPPGGCSPLWGSGHRVPGARWRWLLRRGGCERGPGVRPGWRRQQQALAHATHVPARFPASPARGPAPGWGGGHKHAAPNVQQKLAGH